MMERSTDEKPLKPRLKQVLDLLPKHNWVISKAAMETGYSKTYAEKRLPKRLRENPAWSRALDAKRQKLHEAIEFDLVRWLREQIAVLEDAKEAHDLAARQAALTSLGKHLGAYEKHNQQRQSQIGILINGQVDQEGG